MSICYEINQIGINFCLLLEKRKKRMTDVSKWTRDDFVTNYIDTIDELLKSEESRQNLIPVLLLCSKDRMKLFERTLSEEGFKEHEELHLLRIIAFIELYYIDYRAQHVKFSAKDLLASHLNAFSSVKAYMPFPARESTLSLEKKDRKSKLRVSLLSITSNNVWNLRGILGHDRLFECTLHDVVALLSQMKNKLDSIQCIDFGCNDLKDSDLQLVRKIVLQLPNCCEVDLSENSLEIEDKDAVVHLKAILNQVTWVDLRLNPYSATIFKSLDKHMFSKLIYILNLDDYEPEEAEQTIFLDVSQHTHKQYKNLN